MGCYIWYSEEGWVPAQSPSLLAVPNVTAHPSTASVPITVLLYDGPLLCGFNAAIKGLSCRRKSGGWVLLRDDVVILSVCLFVCSYVCCYEIHASDAGLLVASINAPHLIDGRR